MGKELTNEDKDIIKELVSNQAICEPEDINEETRLQEDLTMDSLDIFELIMRIEKEFNICIPDNLIEETKTVEQLFNLVIRNI